MMKLGRIDIETNSCKYVALGINQETKINKGLGNHDKIVDVKPDPYNENVLWCAAWGSG